MHRLPSRLIVFGLVLLVVLTLLPWWGEISSAFSPSEEIALSTPLQQPLPPLGTGHSASAPASSVRITITAAGFTPSVVTVSLGTQVTWYNATSISQLLKSGEASFSLYLPALLRNTTTSANPPGRSSSSSTLYLPWVSKNGTGSSPAPRVEPKLPAPAPTVARPLRPTDFSAVIPPGGTFTQLFDTLGQFPFFLGTDTRFLGRIIVEAAVHPPDFQLGVQPTSRTVLAGSSATYTVILTATGALPGPVSLTLLGLPSGAGASFGTGSLSPGHSTVLTVTTQHSTPVGTHALTLQGTSGTLTRTVSLALIVQAPPQPDFQLSVQPSSRTVSQGNSISFTLGLTATGGFSSSVSLSLGGLPAGVEETVSANPVTLNASPVLTLSVAPTTTVGTYPLTVQASGGGVTHTASLTLQVQPPPDFQVGLEPVSLSVIQGSSVTSTLLLTGTYGFASPVTLSLAGLPAGVSAALTANPITPSGSAVLTLRTALTTTTATYPISLQGSGGGLTHTLPFNLVIQPIPPDFQIGAQPTSQSISQGSSITYTLRVTGTNGFSSPVSLSVSGLPAGASGTFALNPVTTNASLVLTVTTSSATPISTYPLTLQGSGGGINHTVPITLNVQATADFTVGIAPASHSVSQGASVTYRVLVTGTNGFASPVTLTLANLPSGATGAFGNNPVLPSSSTLVTISTAVTTPASAYSFSVQGQSGTIIHNTSAGLNVTATPRTLCGNITQNTYLPAAYNVYVVTCNVTVNSGATLTLEPGVIVKFNANTSMQIQAGAALSATGTSADPIYFTSIKDDSVGGDTNNDGNITVPARGDWGEIQVQATSNPAFADGSLNFDYVTVRYGGYLAQLVSLAGAASISHSTFAWAQGNGVSVSPAGNPSSAVTINASTFAQASGAGVFLNGRAATITGSTFSENPLHLDNSTGATISNNTITHSGGYSGYGIQLSNSTPALTNNTVSGWNYPVMINGGYPQQVPTYSGNTFTGNQYSAIGVTGNLTSGTWQNFGGYLHAILGQATVPSLATLTIPGGTIIKMVGGASLVVQYRATLNAIGTSANPIYFTSIKDDSVGGDTNNDGNITVPGPGDWGQIQIQATSNPAFADGSLNFDYVTVRYGGYLAQLVSLAGAASISHSTFAWAQGNGVSVSPAGNPSSGIAISGANSFYSNSGYGLYNSRAVTIDARNNWWGSDSGPRHPSNPYGTGDRVSDNVLFDPWIGKSAYVPHNASPSTSWTGFVAEPVNVVFGNYTYQHTDLSVPSIGLPFTFQRSYNSANASTNGPLGYGWTHGYNWSVVAEATGAGNTVLVTGADGRVDRFTQNPDGSFSAPAGIFDQLTFSSGLYALTRKDQTKFNFNGSGKLASVVDKNGNTVTLNYSGGLLSSLTDPGGRTFSFTPDAAGRISVMTDPIGRAISFGYDPSGDLATSTDARGKITTYAYDANHRLVSITDANNHTFVQNTYDAGGRVIEQRDAKLNLTTFSYDTTNLRTTVTDAKTHATVYTYDNLFRITSEKDALIHTISYIYDGDNNRTQVTDKRGSTTRYSYDSLGNTTVITDALTRVTRFTYDTHNNLLFKTDALGRTITNTYDLHGNLQTTTNISGTTGFGYNSRGLLTSVTDAQSHITRYTYNPNGDRISITDPLTHTTSASFDNGGRQLSQSDPLNHTTQFSYNNNNNLTGVLDPLNHSTSYSYDNVGNKIATTDASGNLTRFSYDEKDQLAVVTDTLGSHVTYTYDAVGNKTGMIDANNHTTTYTYDELNRLKTVTDPLSHTTTYGYDANGNKTSVLDANGQTTTFTYDALNRLTRIQYPTYQVNYTYDAVGNRLSMADPIGTTSYTYNGLDRLTQVQAPSGTVRYTYDAVGNRTSLTYPNNNIATYSYDAADRLQTVTDWGSRVFTYTYDAASNRTALDYPTGAHTAYTYDSLNRSTAITTTTPGSGTLFFARYALDNVGNRSQMVDSEGTTDYSYDGLYRLSGVSYPDGTSTQYRYDAMGNRTTMTSTVNGVTGYSYDSADRLLTAGGTSFTWDSNGNQLSKGTSSYQYDVANRLTRVVTGTTTVQMTYDGDGKRSRKTVNSTATNYAYDIDTPLPLVLTETTGGTATSYLYGADLLAQYDNNGVPTYFHADGLGSTRVMSNGSGQSVASYNYDAFGAVRSATGENSSFRFTGQQTDDETGLIYLRARYYDPGTGRFLSPDPFHGLADQAQSLAKYPYTQNNSATYVDPSGKFILVAVVGLGVTGAVVFAALSHPSPVNAPEPDGTGYRRMEFRPVVHATVAFAVNRLFAPVSNLIRGGGHATSLIEGLSRCGFGCGLSGSLVGLNLGLAKESVSDPVGDWLDRILYPDYDVPVYLGRFIPGSGGGGAYDGWGEPPGRACRDVRAETLR